MAAPAAVWMDQGGTFTDVVTLGPAGTTVTKVPSDKADLVALAQGVALPRRGTTIATNALLEGRGAPVLLLTNEGLTALADLGDQTRPDLFALRLPPPRRLAAQIIAVEGRIAADGQVLAPAKVDHAALAAAFAAGLRSIAIVLAFGPLAPEEERRLGEEAAAIGFTTISLGHAVAPSRGLLDRLRTTLIDAATSPLLPRAPGLYLRSDGGAARPDPDEWRGSNAILSGPAGGVVAALALAKAAGVDRAFSFDMGGTSTDVALLRGAIPRADTLTVDGLRLRTPAVQIDTVAAGGGSLLGRNAGVFTVGPRSAGADPGPACYGRGGPAALSDVEAVLGRLPGFPAVCGPGRDQPLDPSAAAAALRPLDPTRPIEPLAAALRSVAHATMAHAIGRLAAAEGEPLAGAALIAFGGAGPAHACGVARTLGLTRVLVPDLAGALSAVGVGLARRRATRTLPLQGPLPAALAAARAALPFPGEVTLHLAARHVGTSLLIEIAPDPARGDHPTLCPAEEERFHAAHEARFGFRRPGHAIEVVEVRAAVEEGDPIALPPSPPAPAGPTTTLAWFDGWRTVPCLPVDALPAALPGPALLRGAGFTLVVEPGWVARRGPAWVELTDEAPAPPPITAAFDPAGTALFAGQLGAIATQMGEQLARLARSVSIRERRDFSCALFDKAGQLLVNAPHVPVHLGAMGETVRDLLARHPADLAPGAAWASNDPAAGGSHLPDITVTMPVFADGALLGFVACRGHHADVGGLTPGSMPPFSRTLADEGLVLRQVPIAAAGRFLPPDLPGCRQPETVTADLEAQIAAVHFGATRLQALADLLGPAVIFAQSAHLLDAAEAATRATLRRLPGRHAATERLDDGTLLQVDLHIADGAATVHLTGPPHPGNWNAPRGVARAALLYVFRCLIDEDLPLNEGALRPFTLHIPPNSLLDPAPGAAVVAGNVETSQRLCDALFAALGALAPSQGTMNNLTLGTPAGASYETIGGGMGASPQGPGASAIQVHMTNTRATDLEELEHRFPLRLRAWGPRPSSGGPGLHPGGDGTEKIWQFLAPTTVALLAGRRDAGAPGLAGGLPGLPGEDHRDTGQGWEPAPPVWEARPGDLLRIRTPGGGGWGPA